MCEYYNLSLTEHSESVAADMKFKGIHHGKEYKICYTTQK